MWYYQPLDGLGMWVMAGVSGCGLFSDPIYKMGKPFINIIHFHIMFQLLYAFVIKFTSFE